MGDSTDYRGIWDQIIDGSRGPVQIIYVAEEQVNLDELVDWGGYTGWWDIRIVKTINEAIEEQHSEPAELFILCGTNKKDAEILSGRFKSVPISIANRGGFRGFPEGWPPQVVVAQWAAPRPGEFSDSVAEALSYTKNELIYSQDSSDISLFSSVSDELLRRLSEFPQDRFLLEPRIFEETVAELLHRMGYEVQLTPMSGDKGRDIIANLVTPAAPLLMLVECKRYAAHRLVGPEPITRLWFQSLEEKANIAMLVTTSSFQKVARRTANTRGYQISLKDGDDFIEWVRSFKTRLPKS